MPESVAFFLFLLICVATTLAWRHLAHLTRGGLAFRQKEEHANRLFRLTLEKVEDEEGFSTIVRHYSKMGRSRSVFFMAYLLREKLNYSIVKEVENGKSAGAILLDTPKGERIQLVAAKNHASVSVESIRNKFSHVLANKNITIWVIVFGDISKKLHEASKHTKRIKLISPADMARLALKKTGD